jgi:hypothetical protein
MIAKKTAAYTKLNKPIIISIDRGITGRPYYLSCKKWFHHLNVLDSQRRYNIVKYVFTCFTDNNVEIGVDYEQDDR